MYDFNDAINGIFLFFVGGTGGGREIDSIKWEI